MPSIHNLKNLHTKLQTLSQELGVNFRVVRYQGITLAPNPRIRSKSLNNQNRAQATANPVNNYGFEGYQAFLDINGLAASGINPTTALAPAAEWEMSEDEGASFFPVTIFNKPVFQSSRYIVNFMRRLASANLIITFPEQIAGGGVTADADGNPLPFSTPAQLECLMAQSRSANTVNSIPGVTPASIRLEGRCLSPLTLPSGLIPLRQFPAVLQDNASGLTFPGRFILTVSAPEIWTPNSQSQGQKIEGWFTLSA